MGSGSVASASHPDGSKWPSLTSSLVFVIYEGAMHNILNQVELASYMLPLLYQSEFPGNGVKSQRNSQISIRYPHAPADTSCSDYEETQESKRHSLINWLLGAQAITLVLLLCAVAYGYILHSRLRAISLSSQLLSTDTKTSFGREAYRNGNGNGSN